MSLHLTTTTANLMDEFLDAEQPKVSPLGYISLESLIRRILVWFDAEDLDVLNVGINEALRYSAWIAEYRGEDGQSYAVGTVLNYLKAARRFFDFLVHTERIKSNPFKALRYPRQPQHMTRNVLTEAQMGRLLQALKGFADSPTVRDRHRRYRVHVIAEFLYATGLRIAEACTLSEENLDLEHRLVYVPQGKGGRPRMAFLHGYAAQIMEHYVRVGRSAVMRDNQNDGSLFGAEKHRMVVLINQELKTVCTALDLPIITTHGFRHSLGTHLLRAGCDMRHIQVILGHEALSTTQIYTRVDKDDLKRSLDQFHPRQFRQKLSGDSGGQSPHPRRLGYEY